MGLNNGGSKKVRFFFFLLRKEKQADWCSQKKTCQQIKDSEVKEKKETVGGIRILKYQKRLALRKLIFKIHL